MTTTLMSPSTPRLSEVARHLVYPEGIVASGWPRIERRLADMAIRYDSWQEGAARLILGRTPEGRYAATVGGVTMSLPRQVGKTFTVGSLLVAMCIEYPGLRVVWTSHHLRTTTNTFRAMQGMVRRKKIAPFIRTIRVANGEQEITFTNGSIIMFGAREHGFGVGIDAIDVLVCDEAQRLQSKSLADMIPTTNVARHEHGALLFFIGTPPRPTDTGDEFAARRAKALAGKMSNGIYIELSADEDADLDDTTQWAKANASYPHRTPHESMLRLRENLTDDGDWRREALGIWDDEKRMGVFSPGAWVSCGSTKKPPKPAALGLALDADRVWLSLGACSSFPQPHLGSVRRVRLDVDRDKLLDQLAEIANRLHIPVALDARGPASSLVEEIEERGVTVMRAGLEDYIKACADLYDAVEVRALSHGHYDDLDAAVAAAGWRKVGDRRVWSRRSGDISMLEAATFALWAVMSEPDYDPLDSIL